MNAAQAVFLASIVLGWLLGCLVAFAMHWTPNHAIAAEQVGMMAGFAVGAALGLYVRSRR